MPIAILRVRSDGSCPFAERKYLTVDCVRGRLLFGRDARVESGSNSRPKDLQGEAFGSADGNQPLDFE
jgi:hypothetical protein